MSPFFSSLILFPSLSFSSIRVSTRPESVRFILHSFSMCTLKVFNELVLDLSIYGFGQSCAIIITVV